MKQPQELFLLLSFLFPLTTLPVVPLKQCPVHRKRLIKVSSYWGMNSIPNLGREQHPAVRRKLYSAGESALQSGKHFTELR